MDDKNKKIDMTHETILSDEPIETMCFAESFAHMIQLFRILTDNMDFSQPFRVEIEYDPKQLRTKQRLYLSKESLERYIEKVGGI